MNVGQTAWKEVINCKMAKGVEMTGRGEKEAGGTDKTQRGAMVLRVGR